MDIDEEKDKKFHNVDTQLDRSARFCNFPSTRVVEIFYQKIETKEDPQFIITRMQHYQEKSPYRWEFTNSNDEAKQKFQVSVTVNFYEEKQDLELFRPVPVSFGGIPRSSLYPFYVYEAGK